MIICGYGRSGQNLARLLEPRGIAVHRARPRPRPRAPGRRRRPERGVRRRGAAAEPDGRRPGARQRGGRHLPRHAVGAEDPAAWSRAHAPQVPVIVRTIDDGDLERLRAAGATEVVPEAIEGSLMLASHALALVGVPMRRVIRIVQDAARRALQPAARLLPRRRRRHRRRAAAGAAAQRHAAGRPRAASARRSATRRCTRSACSVVSVRRALGRGACAPTTTCVLGGRRHAGAVGPARAAGAGRGEAAGAASVEATRPPRPRRAAAAPSLR